MLHFSYGSTRLVFLTKRHAYKVMRPRTGVVWCLREVFAGNIPSVKEALNKGILCGFRANRQEFVISRRHSADYPIAPVTRIYFRGVIIRMERMETLNAHKRMGKTPAGDLFQARHLGFSPKTGTLYHIDYGHPGTSFQLWQNYGQSVT